MASNVFVVDSTARRSQIKVQPGTYLRSVLEEACTKLKLDPEQYTLKNGKKQVDLSLTYRLSGLVSGAKLDLVQASRSPSVVNVALQLPDSEQSLRLSDKFPSNTSLWQVLRKFEEGVAGQGPRNLNITQRATPTPTTTDSGAGRLCYEQPCINVMGRELTNIADLQKTLAQLGFNSGSVLLRLNFKSNGTPMEEAMAQISAYFASVQPTTSSEPETLSANRTPAPGGAPDTSSVSNDTTQAISPLGDHIPATTNDAGPSESVSHSDASAVPPIASSSSASFAQDPQTSDPTAAAAPAPAPSTPKVSIYAAPTGNRPLAATQLHNESDFVPTIDHATAHQAILNRQAQNKRLASDKELESQASEKRAALASIRGVTVRVRLPDQMMVDLELDQHASVAGLYATVRGMLENETLPFGLRYSSPTGPVLLDSNSDAKVIQDLGMTGRILVNMSWDPSVGAEDKANPVMKGVHRHQARELEVPLPQDENSSSVRDDASSAGPLAGKEQKKERNKGDVEARMKKFLGLGKK